MASSSSVSKRVDPLKRQTGADGGWDGFSWYEPHGVNGGDPRFHSVSNLNFMPLAGNQLIDHGVRLDEVRDDHQGTLRPLGAGYDIGAFEATGAVLRRLVEQTELTIQTN